MMKKIIVILLCATVALAHYSDYYWRDFDGDIPYDAIPANEGGQGGLVYVGQGYFPGVGILPGALHPGSMKLQVTERGNLPTITKNIKILCSNSTTGFVKWMYVRYPDIECLKKFHAITIVNGGTETNTDVYIGKHLVQGTMSVGKVYNVAPYQGLNVPDNKGSSLNFQDFELLVYM